MGKQALTLFLAHLWDGAEGAAPCPEIPLPTPARRESPALPRYTRGGQAQPTLQCLFALHSVTQLPASLLQRVILGSGPLKTWQQMLVLEGR